MTLKLLFRAGACLAACLALQACTAPQIAAADAVANAGCHIASDYEARDPKVQQKHPGVVVGQTLLCDAVADPAAADAATKLLAPPPAPVTQAPLPPASVNPGELAQ